MDPKRKESLAKTLQQYLDFRDVRLRPSAEKQEQLEIFGKLQGLKSNLLTNETKIPK